MVEKETIVATQEGAAPPSARSVAMERMRKRHPDTEYADDDDEALYSAMNADMDEDEAELNGLREREGKFVEMFEKDPRTTAFLASWAKGENPYVAMARVFGSELFEKADDPEFIQQMTEANEEYLNRLNKSKELDAEHDKNFEETMAIVNRLEEEGMSEDDVKYALETAAKIVDDGIVGLISEETLRMIVEAKNKEKDIEDARHEAEVKGRNAKITEMKRSAKSSDGVTQLGNSNQVGSGNRNRGIFGLASEAR